MQLKHLATRNHCPIVSTFQSASPWQYVRDAVLERGLLVKGFTMPLYAEITILALSGSLFYGLKMHRQVEGLIGIKDIDVR